MNKNLHRTFKTLRHELRQRRRLTAIALILVLGLAVYFTSGDHGANPPGMGRGGPGGAGMVSLVDTAKVKRRPIFESISAVGTLLAQESVVLRPEIAGIIEKVHFEEGQDVKKDQLLISIDNAIPRAELAQAEANLALAQSNFERSQRLGKTGVTSQQTVDTSKAQLGVNTANVAVARAQLEKTELRAPIPGRIGIRKISPGNWVPAGTELATVETLDPLKLDFSVPEVFLRNLQVGMPVGIMVDALGSEHFTGKITVVDPKIDERTRTLKLRADVDNKDFKLRPGLFARVTIPLQNTVQPLAVPEAAIVPLADRAFVFRIEEGKAKNTPVKLGLRNAGSVEIAEGLKENDVVVTAGQMRLQDGMSVKAREAAPASPAPAPVAGKGS